MLNLAALDLKACWKRIPTMMDAFRGGRWMAVGGPPEYNVDPQNSWRVGYGDIYIYNYMILYNSILMGL